MLSDLLWFYLFHLVESFIKFMSHTESKILRLLSLFIMYNNFSISLYYTVPNCSKAKLSSFFLNNIALAYLLSVPD